MAQTFLKRTRKFLSKTTLQESYATIVLAGIIVVVLGLLVANYFTKRGQQIDSGEQTTQTQEEAKTLGEYKVVAGDSLSAISQKYYDSMDFWPVLARENNIKNPNLIFVDSNLIIPAKGEAEKIRTLLTQTSYKVEAEETLFIIAQKVYGDGSKWVILDKANGSRRLPNGNPLVFAGSSIVIPR